MQGGCGVVTDEKISSKVSYLHMYHEPYTMYQVLQKNIYASFVWLVQIYCDKTTFL